MRRLASLALLLTFLAVQNGFGQETIRYVFVDADCEAGFEALPDTDKKHILTEIKAMTFDDPAKVSFADNDVKGLFKMAIKDEYPQSVNQLKGIYVYILNSTDEAQVKREQLIEKYHQKGIALISLEF